MTLNPAADSSASRVRRPRCSPLGYQTWSVGPALRSARKTMIRSLGIVPSRSGRGAPLGRAIDQPFRPNSVVGFAFGKTFLTTRSTRSRTSANGWAGTALHGARGA